MTGVPSCPAVEWQQHRDAAPHRLTGLAQCSDLSLGKAKALVRAGKGYGAPSTPSAVGGAQLLTFCPPGPRAPGKPVEPFSPCSPLTPCKQKPRSAQGRRQSSGHSMATAQPWRPPRLAPAAPLAAKQHATVPTSTSTWGTGMPSCSGPSVHRLINSPPWSPTQQLPALHKPTQPCTFSPGMPCSPLSPLSPSVPFRPRSPCKTGNTRRGQGTGKHSDTCWGGEDTPPQGRVMGVHRVAEGKGTMCSAREGPLAARSPSSSSGRQRYVGSCSVPFGRRGAGSDL